MRLLRFAAFAVAVCAAGHAMAAGVHRHHAAAKHASAKVRWEKCTEDFIEAIFEEGRKKHPWNRNCIHVSGWTAWERAIEHCGPRPLS